MSLPQDWGSSGAYPCPKPCWCQSFSQWELWVQPTSNIVPQVEPGQLRHVAVWQNISANFCFKVILRKQYLSQRSKGQDMCLNSSVASLKLFRFNHLIKDIMNNQLKYLTSQEMTKIVFRYGMLSKLCTKRVQFKTPMVKLKSNHCLSGLLKPMPIACWAG